MEKKEFIENVIYYGLIIGLCYLFVHYLLDIISPFIWGFAIAVGLNKLFKAIAKRNIKKYEIVIILTAFYILLFTIISTTGVSLTNTLIDAFKALPSTYNSTIKPMIEGLSEKINGISNPTIVEAMSDVLNELSSLLVTISKNAVTWLTSVLTKVPDILLNTTLVIVTSFFVMFDYENVTEAIRMFINDKTNGLFMEVEDFIKDKLSKVIVAYVIIFLLTFIELVLGLLFLNLKNTVLTSFIIAFLDILPILGVGTVLIPWGIIELIYGNLSGIWILVLYFIITFVRQYVEPKLVGANLELHPLVSLVAMIVGLQLLGFLGMFGLPLLISFMQYHDQKTEHIQHAQQ